ncbi:hypothetical protein MRX96_014951 [Rhipicephalus microplus]
MSQRDYRMCFSTIVLRPLFRYRNIASYRSTHATNHCTTSHSYTCGAGSWHANVYAKSSADKGHARSDKASDESTDNSTHSRPDCSAFA